MRESPDAGIRVGVVRAGGALAVGAAVVLWWSGALPLRHALLLPTLLLLLPVLGVAQAPLVRLLTERDRIPLYLGSAVTITLAGALALLAGLPGPGAEAMGLVLGDPASFVSRTAALLAASAGLVLLSLLAGRLLGLEEPPYLRVLVPRTGRERGVFALLSVAAGVGEETAFRSYALPVAMEAGLGPLSAVLVTSAAFGLLHAYQGLPGIVRTGALGGLFAVSLAAWGTVLPAMAAHTLLDWGMGLWVGPRMLEAKEGGPPDARLAEIRVHPVKSLSGMRVREWPLVGTGLLHDREWMVVGPDGSSITQRELPAMALLSASIDREALVLEASGAPDLRLDLARSREADRRKVVVWGDEVEAEDEGGEAAAWLSERLGRDVRLVRFPPDAHRPTGPGHAEGHRVAFADGYPLLLLGRASLDDLARRAGREIAAERFRPNLVVEGAEPYAEDGWRRIRVGDVEMEVVKPCARCSVPSVDPRTGAREREPLRTLATYRRLEGRTYLGQNLVHLAGGTLREGDAVRVLERGAPRPAPGEPDTDPLAGNHREGES